MSKIKQHRLRLLSTSCLAVSMLAIPTLTMAQGGLLEEIIVTAAKRSQTLQEIPISVSVTSADTIDKAQILDLKDLQSVVPSLRISTLQNSTNTNFFIRGFGNGANNPGIEPSVGVFIDGVYRSRSAAAISDLPNLERIEVLRGPQSTLFGKNASAGVISIVTKEPTGEFGGKVSATLGNYNQAILKGQIEGAISENVAFDIAAGTNTRDGYFTNTVTGNDINDRDRQFVRGQLVFRPSDDTKIRLIADYDKFDEKCCVVVNIFTSPLETFTNAATGAGLVSNSPFANEGSYNIDPINELENAGISMQIDHDYDNLSVTSITAFRTVDTRTLFDADFTSAGYINNDVATELETFTQEVRLSSKGDGAVDWMIGGFYFDEAVENTNSLPYGQQFRTLIDSLAFAGSGFTQMNTLAGIEQALGLPVFQTFFPAGQGISEEATLDNQAISLFGQLDWHVSDRLTATVGLNYTKDEKEAAVTQTQNDTFSSIDFVQLGFGAIFQQLTGAGVPPQVAAAQAQALGTTSSNPFLALQPLQFLPPLQDFPNAVEDGKTDDDELTYTVRLAFDVNDSINVYGGVSTGFKASSWNLSRDSRPSVADLGAIRAGGFAVNNINAGTRFAAPEEATVVELGLKARFERGALNVAIFDQSIKGFQSNIFTGSGFNLANAEKQSTKGLEFDLTYFPVDSLKLTLAGTFLDPKYDSFTGASGPNGPDDLSGTTPAGIHKTSLTGSATYNFVLASGVNAYLRGDYQYDDEVPTNDNIPEEYSTEQIKNLNLSAGITTDNGLGFSIWGRNVTDHETLTTGFPTVAGTGGIFGYHNQPRTYGVSLSKEF